MPPRRTSRADSPRRPSPSGGVPRSARRPAAPPRRTGLTGRAAVLGLVISALVLSLAYPLKDYLGQRGQLDRLQHDKQGIEQRVADLERQRRQLDDPAYIQSQARKRLQYVMPGDQVYVVITPGQPSGDPATAPAPAPTTGSGQPWYTRLWGTVDAADSSP